MNVYFLYTRLPGYFISCIETLVSKDDNIHAYCIVYRPSGEAPYVHKSYDRITIRYRDELSLKLMSDLFIQNPPSVIYVAGWIDKDYLNIARKFNKTIPVVVGMDNPWKGTVRQRISSVIASSHLKKHFSHIWVPGVRQYEFARRLGFSHKHILRGLYCADERIIQNDLNSKEYDGKTLLFVGRLVDYKHPSWIVRAFETLFEEGQFADWSVVLLGNGPLYEELNKRSEKYQQIRIIKFVQPAEITKYYSRASIFCFPSSGEHWGVVVHEAALAGLPMLLSDSCAAADEFLIHGYNGYRFESDNYESFFGELRKLLKLDEDGLRKMGAASMELAEKINHETWCATFLSVLK